MLETALDAKNRLEEAGLHVSLQGDHSLWVAAAVRDAGEGVQVSEDACALTRKADRWVAVFPADGLLTYEVPGTLPDLVSVVLGVYDHHRRAGGAFRAAFKQVVSSPEQYLVGRPAPRAAGQVGPAAPGGTPAEPLQPT